MVEVVEEPVGKRRSIIAIVPAQCPRRPQPSRAHLFFVCVVHTMSVMAGAMQFSQRYVDIAMPVALNHPPGDELHH